jgi:hypothetical protein
LKKQEEEYLNNPQNNFTTNTFNSIDSRSYLDKSYFISNIPEQNWENTIININNKTYNISPDEYKIIFWEDKNNKKFVKSPEALKNLVDFKEKMNSLNLWFVRKFRTSLIKAMNNLDWTSWINTTDNNFINKSEVKKLLNFVLRVIWEEPWDTLSSVTAKIILLNWWFFSQNKKDTISGLSNIWMKFFEKWILNTSWELDLYGYSRLIDKQKYKKVNE